MTNHSDGVFVGEVVTPVDPVGPLGIVVEPSVVGKRQVVDTCRLGEVVVVGRPSRL